MPSQPLFTGFPFGGLSFNRAILGRLTGPGGLYNVGNLIALTAVLAERVRAPSPTGSGVLVANWLMLALAIFFLAGEAYHRGARHVGPRQARLIRAGDLMSGIAAMVLTGALAAMGETTLALAAGVLLAGGKFGSAVLPRHAPPPFDWLLRGSVAASRLPSLTLLGLEIARRLSQGGDAASILMPATTFLCFVLWLWADLLLWHIARQAVPSGPPDRA